MNVTFYPHVGDAVPFKVARDEPLGGIVAALSKIQGVPSTGVRLFVNGKQMAPTAENRVLVPGGLWLKVVLVQDLSSDWLNWKTWLVR